MSNALTAPEVAKLLSVSLITVYRKAKLGLIPSFRVGTSVRFSAEAIERLKGLNA